MTLSPGARLGSYVIEVPLGAGGMGEVYRAKDMRLDRTVAIKVLPAALASDPQFRERFEREGRSISALNHPNICTLYDVGHHDGVDFLVMEYLEGETLQAKLEKAPLPVADALNIAIDIARALDRAHRRGVIHRDLKPGNVMVTKTGSKLLDFGLAKVAIPGVTSAAALTAMATSPPPSAQPLTAQGTILGTFQYMAPEQIEGEESDARSDIFAFGAVLYEMLTGRKAFTGRTHASLMGAIMKDEPPPVSSVMPSAAASGRLRPARGAESPSASERGWGPASIQMLDWVVQRCLAKDPDDRWQTARDLMFQLSWIAHGGGQLTMVSAPAPAALTRGRRVAQVVLPALAVGLLASTATWLVLGPRPIPSLPLARFAIPVPKEAPLVRVSGGGVAMSPDGRAVVFAVQPAGQSRSVLYLRMIGALASEPIRGTEGAFAPFFSPNSEWIGFFTNDHIKRVPMAGGPASTICDKGTFSRASWAPDGTIVLGTSLSFKSGPLFRVPANGGTPAPLTTLVTGKEVLHQLPHVLPDGRHVLFTVVGTDHAELAVTSLDSGVHQLLNVEGSGPAYVAPGSLLFARGDVMFSAPFDLSRHTVTGPAVGVLDDAAVLLTGNFSVPFVGVDGRGAVAYIKKEQVSDASLAWMDEAGKVIPIAGGPANYQSVRLSPDGRRLATIMTDQKRAWNLSVLDLERGIRLILTSELVRTSDWSPDNRPVWSPDGTHIAYSAGMVPDLGVRTIPSDGSGGAELLLNLDDMSTTPRQWSPDGTTLIFVARDRVRTRGSRDQNIGFMVRGSKPAMLLNSPADESGPALSPDGHWLAYVSNVSGRDETYIRSFPGPGGTIPVSSGGGTNPLWARNGTSLYFMEGRRLMRAPIQLRPFQVGTPVRLADVPIGIEIGDIGADGRFLVMERKDTTGPEELHILLNWGTSLQSGSQRF